MKIVTECSFLLWLEITFSNNIFFSFNIIHWYLYCFLLCVHDNI
jgi:hypothetical protein